MCPVGIPSQRIVDATITLRAADGSLLPAERELTVTQTRHVFLFGSTGFDAIPLVNGELDSAELAPEREGVERFYGLWSELFNAVTMPFYWYFYEPWEGAPDDRR